ncbi:MAG: EamA family transporter [Ignavibacteriales bacterium]|nr:EamA family transporter [Ignavibacteriales bacterium]
MNNSYKQNENKYELLLIIVVLLWGTNYPIAKYGLSGLGGFIFNSMRFITAATILAIFLLLKGKWLSIDLNDRVRFLQVGIISSVIYQIFFIVGLSKTTAGNSAILLATSPLWTIIFNSWFNKERIFANVWWGMMISLFGIILIVTGGSKTIEFNKNDIIGDLITLAAAALWALNTHMQKPLLTRYSAAQLAFSQFLIGAIGLSIVAIPSAFSFNWTTVKPTYYLSAILSGSLAIAAANIIWSYGIQKLGPGRTANYSNLVPIVALLVSYFTLNENLSPIQIGGAVMTLLGVGIARK